MEPETFSGDRIVGFFPVRMDTERPPRSGGERVGPGCFAPLQAGRSRATPAPCRRAGAPPCRDHTDGPAGRGLPSGRAESADLIFLHLEDHPRNPPQNLKTLSASRNPLGQSFLLLCWWVCYFFFFFSLAACLSVIGAEQVGGKYVSGAGRETQMPIALYINFPP